MAQALIQPVTEATIQSFIDNHDPQDGCVLFTKLPAEMRNDIFALTLRQYYKESHRYDTTSYHSRPGYRAPLEVDTTLLRTCRKIYLETRLLPIQQYEHIFWCRRGPSGSIFAGNPKSYFATGTFPHTLLPHVDTIQIFAQLYWLEQQFPAECRRLSTLPLPRRLKITVRHSDWWYWESSTPLEMKKEWIEGLRHLHSGLQEFVVELETIERDKDQMLAIAEDMRTWSVETADGNKLTPGEGVHFEQRKESNVLGEYRFDKSQNAWIDDFHIPYDDPEDDSEDQSESMSADGDDVVTEERQNNEIQSSLDLVYCVATLVWRV